MTPHTDQDGNQWWVLSEDEIKLGFLAQCVERVASALREDYRVVFHRLEAADLTEGFILRHYDVLHSQDLSNVIDDILTALKNREEKSYKILDTNG